MGHMRILPSWHPVCSADLCSFPIVGSSLSDPNYHFHDMHMMRPYPPILWENMREYDHHNQRWDAVIRYVLRTFRSVPTELSPGCQPLETYLEDGGPQSSSAGRDTSSFPTCLALIGGSRLEQGTFTVYNQEDLRTRPQVTYKAIHI